MSPITTPPRSVVMIHGAGPAWLQSSARVVATFSGGVWVETMDQSGCHGCAKGASCGTGLLSRWRGRPRLQLLTSNNLQVGDVVRVGIPARGFLGAALMVYAWPLGLALMAGGTAEALTEPGHGTVPLMFATGLAAGVGIARWHGWRWSRRYRLILLAVEDPDLFPNQ